MSRDAPPEPWTAFEVAVAACGLVTVGGLLLAVGVGYDLTFGSLYLMAQAGIAARDHVRVRPRAERGRSGPRVTARPRPSSVRVRRVSAQRRCPLCHEPFSEHLSSRSCPGCETLHHVSCLEELAGCAVLGCSRSRRGARRRVV